MANFIYLTNGFRLTCRVSTPYLLRSKRTDMVRTWYGHGTAEVRRMCRKKAVRKADHQKNGRVARLWRRDSCFFFIIPVAFQHFGYIHKCLGSS